MTLLLDVPATTAISEDESGLLDNLSSSSPSSSGEEDSNVNVNVKIDKEEINEQMVLETKIALIKERLSQLESPLFAKEEQEEYIKYTQQIHAQKEHQLSLCKERLVLRNNLINNHYQYCCKLLADRKLEGEEELWGMCRRQSQSQLRGSTNNIKRKPSIMNIEMLLNGHHNASTTSTYNNSSNSRRNFNIINSTGDPDDVDESKQLDEDVRLLRKK